MSQPTERLSEQDAENVIAMIAVRSRHLAPLPEPRPRAWDRATAALTTVTAEDVKEAWRLVRLARTGLSMGAPDGLYQLRIHDFQFKLEAWLRG